MKIGIFSKPHTPAASDVVPKLFAWLRARNIALRYDLETAHYISDGEALPRHEVADSCDLVIVLGGDGTLLSAARALRGRKIPLLAVNLGGLGFLTAITVDHLFTQLELALAGSAPIDPRRFLHVDLIRNGVKHSHYEALNDVVVTKASIARIIDIETLVDGSFMCTYKADGLIVSTPTGSTAYSLSAGGPIIIPSVEAICVTPICPHMLTNRPVLVPASSVITVIYRSENAPAFLTVDGQVGEPLEPHDLVECRTSTHALWLIRPPETMFFDVLREKLKWGER